ncbi:AraC family transcriptional regulator [Photorhabdus antumapuensis]|uniref:AraC family transcriptional regulator n=1 Tax=Photorhabdus antumapuensis TaxID=2862867 RepID=UPI001CEE0295|nr:AraC family transcriptional regulator [Photorhabdus antumapuensis]MCA6220952.1 AraC family transcriptional regulator [Photorhabdus antumapuensis]
MMNIYQNNEKNGIGTNGHDACNVEFLSALCSGLVNHKPNNLQDILNAVALITPLLNAIPSVVFFIKDIKARYLIANLTLATRCGFKSVSSLLGKTSSEIFPAQMGSCYIEQDLRVLHQGAIIQNQLELHFYHGRKAGWCMTYKLPLYNQHNQIIGMAGISHDLTEVKENHPVYQKLAIVDDYIRENFNRTIRLEELTHLTRLSVAQLERYCKRIFHLTPRQMIHKIRIEKASELLATELPITDIALQCGYTDHSAFTRQFKASTGLTPSDFRQSIWLE